MSEKGSGKCSYQGQGGRGGRGVLCRGRAARGYIYPGDTLKHKGLCYAPGIHLFE